MTKSTYTVTCQIWFSIKRMSNRYKEMWVRCWPRALLELCTSELGTLLFEIAKSLFALERTLILGVMALLNKKSEAQWANWQNQILSGPLMSNIRIKECRKNGWKRHKNERCIHILIKIPTRLPPPPPSSSGACCVGLYSTSLQTWTL